MLLLAGVGRKADGGDWTYHLWRWTGDEWVLVR